MGESFQDNSWIQDFGADFPQKVSLKILNLADYNSFSGFLIVYLKTIDHLNMKLLLFYRHNARLRFKFLKFRIFEIWTFTLTSSSSVKIYRICPKNWDFFPHQPYPKIRSYPHYNQIRCVNGWLERQTVSTQIRLLLQEQSDLGHHCFLRLACPDS